MDEKIIESRKALEKRSKELDKLSSKIALATASELNAMRSSMLPPPRPTIRTSHMLKSLAVLIMFAIVMAAPSP